MSYQPVVFDTAIQIARAFNAGRCVAITGDQSGLYALRLNLAKPDSAIILPEVISKEPLGPVIREGDDRWLNITRWTLAAMINAEELGITSANVDQKRKSTNPEIRRLLGVEGEIDVHWALITIGLIKSSNKWATTVKAFNVMSAKTLL